MNPLNNILWNLYDVGEHLVVLSTPHGQPIELNSNPGEVRYRLLHEPDYAPTNADETVAAYLETLDAIARECYPSKPPFSQEYYNALKASIITELGEINDV